MRKGPNKPSIIGLFVPFADAVKLMVKENNSPSAGHHFVRLASPFFYLFVAFIFWCLNPCEEEKKYGVLIFLCISSVGVFALLFCGWGRNRKYSFMGAVRSVAQSVSYEVILSIICLHFVIFYYFLLNSKLFSLIWIFYVLLLFFLSCLAETNRSPFDFSEGESELVRGFNTEYRSVPFIMIFLAEYCSIVFMSLIIRLLFCMTCMLDLYVFFMLWASVFVWCRGTLPRLRYDQLIYLCWKSLLPVVLGRLILVMQ